MIRYNRISSLDSVRGIAALIVVMSHYIQAFNEMDLLRIRLPIELIYRAFTLLFIWAGHAAVVVFFVLSGYVLSLMLNKKKLPYHIYALKRYIRLYIPYIFSILVSLLFIVCINPKYKIAPGLFFSNKWDGIPQSRDVAASLFFLLPFNSNKINFVVWSLIYEIRISLLFPVILFLSNKMKNTIFILTSTVIPVIFLLLHFFLTPNFNQYNGEIFMTGFYVAPFAAGAFIFRNGAWINQWLLDQSRIKINILFSLSLLFLVFGGPTVNILLSLTSNHLDSLKNLGDILITIGAFVLIAISLYLPVPLNILSKPIFSYLGRISYSLYLTHSIVLLLVFHLLYSKIPSILLILIASLLTIIVSNTTYKFIETPAMNLSRKFSTDLLFNQRSQ